MPVNSTTAPLPQQSGLHHPYQAMQQAALVPRHATAPTQTITTAPMHHPSQTPRTPPSQAHSNTTTTPTPCLWDLQARLGETRNCSTAVRGQWAQCASACCCMTYTRTGTPLQTGTPQSWTFHRLSKAAQTSKSMLQASPCCTLQVITVAVAAASTDLCQRRHDGCW
jgi:hypothetical protein